MNAELLVQVIENTFVRYEPLRDDCECIARNLSNRYKDTMYSKQFEDLYNYIKKENNH